MTYYVAGLLIGAGFMTIEIVVRTAWRWWVSHDDLRLSREFDIISRLHNQGER